MKIIVLLSLLFTLTLYAEEDSIDDLFDDSSDIVITEQSSEQSSATIPGNTVQGKQNLKVAGSISTAAGISAGYSYLPWDERFVPNLDFNAGLTASSSLSIEAHPDSYFTYYAVFTSTVDPLNLGTVLWSNFSISTLYCEYIWLDKVFWKIGKYAFTWGQGRLFNPGNLVSDSGSRYTVMASLPTVLSGAQLFMQFSDGQFGTNVLPIYKTTIYGVKTDMVFMDTYLGFAGRWVPSESLRLLVSLKRTVFGFDIHADGVMTIATAETSSGMPATEIPPITGTILVGFYKQWGDFHTYGEYQLADISNPRQDTGLVIGYNNIFGIPIDPVVKWLHCWTDGSGMLHAGIKWDAWPHVKLEAGLSLVYGTDTGVYVTGNANPKGQRLMAALLVTLSGGF